MEFGWYHEFHRQVEGQSDADAFEQGFEQVEAADRWGLDVFWLAEIHQQARRSVLSAPMNVAGQIAARTKRIKIGTAVHVLPLAIRCGSPRRPRRSIRSAAGGSSSAPDAAATRAATPPMACPIRRAASGFSRRWKS